MRYVTVRLQLGFGQSETVHKVIDVDLGKFMAVNILERLTRVSEDAWRQLL